MLVGTPGGSRLAREPIVAFSNFFRKDRNVFLLFLSKSTFLFLGTCSCTPKSVPAGSQSATTFLKLSFERMHTTLQASGSVAGYICWGGD